MRISAGMNRLRKKTYDEVNIPENQSSLKNHKK